MNSQEIKKSILQSERIVKYGTRAIFVLFIMIFTLWIFGSKYIVNSMKMAEARIGEKMVIGSDTVKIVDYSVFEETFTLSDGSKIYFFTN